MDILKKIFDSDFLNSLVLIILGIGTLVQVLDMLGFLPERVRNYLKLNHAKDTIEVLKEYGIDPALYRRPQWGQVLERGYKKKKSRAKI